MERITKRSQAYRLQPGQIVLDEPRGETLKLIGESFGDYIFQNLENEEIRRLTKWDLLGMYLLT